MISRSPLLACGNSGTYSVFWESPWVQENMCSGDVETCPSKQASMSSESARLYKKIHSFNFKLEFKNYLRISRHPSLKPSIYPSLYDGLLSSINYPQCKKEESWGLLGFKHNKFRRKKKTTVLTIYSWDILSVFICLGCLLVYGFQAWEVINNYLDSVINPT